MHIHTHKRAIVHGLRYVCNATLISGIRLTLTGRHRWERHARRARGSASGLLSFFVCLFCFLQFFECRRSVLPFLKYGGTNARSNVAPVARSSKRAAGKAAAGATGVAHLPGSACPWHREPLSPLCGKRPGAKSASRGSATVWLCVRRMPLFIVLALSLPATCMCSAHMSVVYVIVPGLNELFIFCEGTHTQQSVLDAYSHPRRM